MKFLSIFAPKDRPADVAAPDVPVDLALRVAQVFGVPESHLTPQVRTAFNVMIGEIDSLRLDVDQLKLSLAEAEASADHDPLYVVGQDQPIEGAGESGGDPIGGKDGGGVSGGGRVEQGGHPVAVTAPAGGGTS